MLRILAVVRVAAAMVPALASAADLAGATSHHRAVRQMPRPCQWDGAYPLSWRARKIRRADNCWRGCQAEAGRAFQTCLRVNNSNDCVQSNDAADRYCLRQCRSYGGPLLNLAD